MSNKRDGGKAAIAAEAGGALLDLAMGQPNRFFGILQEFGLTPGDLRALFALDQEPPRPMRTLARAWACDASNVTWIIDRREPRALVERQMLPSDRRVKTVALTPLGASTKAELFTRLHEPPADFLALDRATLQALRDALAGPPAALRTRGPTRSVSPHRLRAGGGAVLGLRRRILALTTTSAARTSRPPGRPGQPVREATRTGAARPGRAARHLPVVMRL